METRKTTVEKAPKLYPEFKIAKLLEQFPPPPCQPPRGLHILERFFEILYSQPPHRRDSNTAARSVATELDDLWKSGDARIPRKDVKTLIKKIINFREDLKYLSDKSKVGSAKYQPRVSQGSE